MIFNYKLFEKTLEQLISVITIQFKVINIYIERAKHSCRERIILRVVTGVQTRINGALNYNDKSRTVQKSL